MTAEAYDRWEDGDPVSVERLASLLGLIARAASGALAAFHRLHGAIADAQPAPAGERWDHERGTAPGRDAEVVQRENDAIAAMTGRK